MNRSLSTSVVVVLCLFTGASAAAGSGDPVAQDQQAMLAHLNAARWDPAGFGDALGIDLDDVVPTPPLAVNPNLTSSARFKADEMADFEYFSHQSAVTGIWPNRLARDSGYALPAWWDDDTNYIESLHSGSPEPMNVVASLAGSPILEHRQHLFGFEFWSDHSEIGVGRSEVDNVWVIHTGYRDEAGVFLSGTVYDDLNHNAQMDPGEGLSGITITAAGLSTLTNGGGGYSIEVPSGKHRIVASGPGFVGKAKATIRVADYNVWADFVSGATRPTIRDYQLCKGRQPTILGTSGDDIIYGTSGPDVIHALDGDDIVYGAKGNDILCGGRGDDILRGGGGRDILLGGRHDDNLNGGFGNDTLKGNLGFDILNGSLATDICLTGEILTNCEG